MGIYEKTMDFDKDKVDSILSLLTFTLENSSYPSSGKSMGQEVWIEKICAFIKTFVVIYIKIKAQ